MSFRRLHGKGAFKEGLAEAVVLGGNSKSKEH